MPTTFCKSIPVYQTETNCTQHRTHLYLYSLYALMKDMSLEENAHSNTTHTMWMVWLCDHTCTCCHILHEWYCVVVTQSAVGKKGGREWWDRHKWEGRKDTNVQKV